MIEGFSDFLPEELLLEALELGLASVRTIALALTAWSAEVGAPKYEQGVRAKPGGLKAEFERLNVKAPQCVTVAVTWLDPAPQTPPRGRGLAWEPGRDKLNSPTFRCVGPSRSGSRRRCAASAARARSARAARSTRRRRPRRTARRRRPSCSRT